MNSILRDKNRIIFSVFQYEHPYVELNRSDFCFEDNLSVWKMIGSKNTIVMSENIGRIADVLRYKNLFKGALDNEKVVKVVIPKIKELLTEFSLIDSENSMKTKIYIAIYGNNSIT